ncbi:MAG: hypothetical protein ABL886_14900, partial [Rhodoglobus sp.]
GAGGVSAVWEVPVATRAERGGVLPRRLFRETEAQPLPRDARPSRARHERLPEVLRVTGASSRIRTESTR